MSVAVIWHNHWNKGRRRRHMVNINTLILIFVVMMVTFSTMAFSAEPNAQAEEKGNQSCQEPIVDAEAVVRSALGVDGEGVRVVLPVVAHLRVAYSYLQLVLNEGLVRVPV